MPRFAANIGDGWLYSNIPFLERIGAASKDGFTAVECGNTHYNYDANKIKSELNKYNMKWVLLNTHSLPEYEKRKDRKYHAIYSDEKELFKKSLLRAYEYSTILNPEMCIHIDVGKLTDKINTQTARKQFIESLKVAQKILDTDKNSENHYKDNKFKLIIEPVNNIVGRGIENYYLWSQHDALSIIKDVNNGYKGSYPIYLQFDFYHAQTHHGDITCFLQKHIQFIKHIQASQCPNRDEPCNGVNGDLNYSMLYPYLDKVLKYDGYVGLEYKPQDKNNTTKGLRLGDWFKGFNVSDMDIKEDGKENESKSDGDIDENKISKLMLEKSLVIVKNAIGKKYTKQIGLKMINECNGDVFLLISKLNFSKGSNDNNDEQAPIDNYQLNLQ
eukprot:174494_1